VIELRRFVPRTRQARLLSALAGIAVVAAVSVAAGWVGLGASPADSTTTTTEPAAIDIVVDASVVPFVSTVPPLEDGGEPRPVGRTVTSSGATYDIVIGEMVVFVADHDALELLRRREDIEVVDYDDEMYEAFGPGDPDAGIEVLVRIIDLADVDTSTVAHDVAALEPELAGTIRVSDADTVATVALMAHLAMAEDLEVALNDVPTLVAIPEGSAMEDGGSDALEWTYVASTAAQQIGLDTAWQMLYFHGRQLNTVRILVIDSGFVPNGDFPSESKIRKGDWGPEPAGMCGGTSCPYHGTQVSATIVGRVDNGYGTAGVAGPFAELVAMPAQGDYYRTTKALREVVKDEKPDVINMSFSLHSTKATNTVRRRWDRTIRWAEEKHGVIAFAAAGNQGLDVDSVDGLMLPCASSRVVCVGGMGTDTTERAAGSNYGSRRTDRSVQIYGPYCTWGYANPDDPSDGSLTEVCGTSVASPFVAGVAALLRVADPSLTPSQIRNILYETAHLGGLGSGPSGHLRRIDAHMAVARALGTTWTPPVVTITAGEGTFPVGEVFSIAATARSYSGEHLPIRWLSSIDGWLAEEPTMASIGGSGLSPGTHIIQAMALDRRGMTGTAALTVTIEHLDPTVSIVSPGPDDLIYEGTLLPLLGFAEDPNPFGGTVDLVGGWSITDADTGQVVWSTSSFPMAQSEALDAGTYTIRFHAVDPHGGTSEDTVTIEVRELEPGWVPPWVWIKRPLPNASFGVTPGSPTAALELEAQAFGTDGNPISGQRFRWTATNNHGDEITLCTGSSFPGAGGGGGGGFGFVTPNDCSSITVQIGLGSGGPTTVWALTLEAVDINGVPVSRPTSLTVVLVVQ
jgi:serine protease